MDHCFCSSSDTDTQWVIIDLLVNTPLSTIVITTALDSDAFFTGDVKIMVSVCVTYIDANMSHTHVT